MSAKELELRELAPRVKTRVWPLFALAACAGLLVAYLTANAIGVWPDSVRYLAAAQGFAHSHSFVEPVISTPRTHYPPLYPLMLAAIDRMDGNTLGGARALNIACFIGSLMLAGLIIRRATQNIWAPIVAMALLLGSVDLLRTHSAVASEPPFYLLTLACLYVLSLHIERPRMGLVAVCGVLAALAMLTRYAGVAVLGASIAGVLLLSRQSISRRFIQACLLGMIALLPSVLVAFNNHATEGSATGRGIVYHAPDAWQRPLLRHTISNWVVSDLIPHHKKVMAVIGVVGLVLAAACLATRKRDSKITPPSEPADSAPRTMLMLIVFNCVYAAVILLTVLFVDATTEFDGRILSPLYIGVVLMSVLAANHIWPAAGVLRIGVSTLVALVVCMRLAGGVMYASQHRDANKVFTVAPWINSNVFQYLTTLPTSVKIVTNDDEAVWFLAHRPAQRLPQKYDAYSMRMSNNYDQNLSKLGEDVRAGKSVVVYFGIRDNRASLPTIDELTQHLKLQKMYESSDDLRAIVLH